MKSIRQIFFLITALFLFSALLIGCQSNPVSEELHRKRRKPKIMRVGQVEKRVGPIILTIRAFRVKLRFGRGMKCLQT